MFRLTVEARPAGHDCCTRCGGAIRAITTEEARRLFGAEFVDLEFFDDLGVTGWTCSACGAGGLMGAL
jgi:hypothetical protein